MTPADMAVIHAAAFAGGETWDAAAIGALLGRPATVAVAEPPLGFALLQVVPPEAELLTIAVRPDAQGDGHGRALLRRALDAAAQAGCASVFLEVAADNNAAIALYAGAGFCETGRRHGYYVRPGHAAADAVTMAVSLAARHSGKARES